MRHLLVKGGVSIAIGAVFIWLAVRDVNWSEVIGVFARIDLLVVGWYILLWVGMHVVRVWRWGMLLKPLGSVSFSRLFTVGMVGFMMLILLPFRLGEFARPFLIAERGGIRISAALATIVVERVVDALSMALLLIGLLYFLEGRVNVPGDLRFWSLIVLVVFIGLLVFLFVAYRRQETTVAWSKKCLTPLPPKLRNRIISVLQSFLGGLRGLPDGRLFGGFLLGTLGFWGLNGLGLWLLFSAFDGLGSLGALEAFTILSVLCVGLMIPAGPGMIGNFHYFVKVGMSLFVSAAVLGSSGVAYAILVHGLQLALHVLFGVSLLFSGHISFSHLLTTPAGVEDGLERPSRS